MWQWQITASCRITSSAHCKFSIVTISDTPAASILDQDWPQNLLLGRRCGGLLILNCDGSIFCFVLFFGGVAFFRGAFMMGEGWESDGEGWGRGCVVGIFRRFDVCVYSVWFGPYFLPTKKTVKVRLLNCCRPHKTTIFLGRRCLDVFLRFGDVESSMPTRIFCGVGVAQCIVALRTPTMW